MRSLARLSGRTPFNGKIGTQVLCINTTEVDIKNIKETAGVAVVEVVATDTIVVRHTLLMDPARQPLPNTIYQGKISIESRPDRCRKGT